MSNYAVKETKAERRGEMVVIAARVNSDWVRLRLSLDRTLKLLVQIQKALADPAKNRIGPKS